MQPDSVHVTFLDSASGAVVGEATLSASFLPERYTETTTLRLGEDDWLVQRVEQGDHPEGSARTLRLHLRPMRSRTVNVRDNIDPHPAIFSTATLAHSLPALSEARAPEGVLWLREGEWRQIELVASAHADVVARELAAIERVIAQSEVKGGYRTVHVRGAMPSPLGAARVALDELRSAFRGVAHEHTGIAFETSERLVRDGYAFKTAGGLVVYGTARDGLAEVIALRPDRLRRGPPLEARALTTLRAQHDLLLVDWPARIAARPKSVAAK